jgi:hypothetical protein
MVKQQTMVNLTILANDPELDNSSILTMNSQASVPGQFSQSPLALLS